jgi:two-component system chemotaxis response regulator CheV
MRHTATRQSVNAVKESGANELEIVEFCVGSEYYGINISKVREIIRVSSGIVPVPDAHPSISGVVNVRGVVLPVVNLAKHLRITTTFDEKISRIIISEFNNFQVGFWVNSVNCIHRLSWDKVESPSELVQSNSGYTVGVIKLDDKIIFLVDFEKITGDINRKMVLPSHNYASRHVPAEEDRNVDRSSKTIMIAEDSPFVSEIMIDHLKKSGYNIELFVNGQDAWETLERLVEAPEFEKVEDVYNLLITDLEMPSLSGVHLIKQVKTHPKLKRLPCIVFSSIISKEMSLKCKSVGADGQLTKPNIDNLVNLVDSKVI